MWWYVFVDKWNGISLAWDLGYHSPEIIVYSDASGSWGCGGYAEKDWFQYRWLVRHQGLSIASKELIPVVISVVISAAIFGRHWSGKLVNFMVDNLAVVQVLQATYCRDTHLMHLIRFTGTACSPFQFLVYCHPYCGERGNTSADALSRNNASLFLSQMPHINQEHSPAATGAISSEHHMDLHILDPAIRRYFSSALATSSHKTYKAAGNKYLTFCNNFSLQPLPSSEALLCYFVACLGQQGLAHSTIRTYLSGVRQLQISHGFPELSFDKMPRLRQILKGVQVEQGKQGKSPRCRLPITPAILRKTESSMAGRKSLIQ